MTIVNLFHDTGRFLDKVDVVTLQFRPYLFHDTGRFLTV